MDAVTGRAGQAAAMDAWLEMFGLVARQYRLPVSEQGARLAGLWHAGRDERQKLSVIAGECGLGLRFAEPGSAQLTRWHLPVIARLRGGGLALITAIGDDGRASLCLAGDGGSRTQAALDAVLADADLLVIARPARSAPDARVDSYIRPFEQNWLRRILMQDRRAYVHVLVASVVANSLGLAGVLFSMQVYDRVIPAESFPTLYILFAGVLIATLFDFLLRRLRTTIIDVLGKRADLRMSDRVFGHALRIRNTARPSSTGSFMAQLRDLEQVRELLTSTTIAAIADLPFFLLFVGIFCFIGGMLVLVPLAGLVLLLVPGLLAQRRLRAYATEASRESSLRNAILVEAVQGLQDIKLLQAEQRFQQQWNHYNAVAGEAHLKLRGLTNGLTTWTQNVQNAVYATIIVCGAPMVIGGDMTTGALVAASILGSRMMAPLAQVTQLLSRFQQARVAMTSLDQIMALPVDDPGREQRIPLPQAAGGFAVRSAVFRYGDASSSPALNVQALAIAPGERIALLGRNGAGKSTLLQALSGMLPPSSGEVLLDGLALHQIDPADVRRDVGLLTQDSRLFHGTLRENLMLGAPHAADEAILQALAMSGADECVRRLRDGLQHVVQENGAGLSGGQIQSLLLARLLLRQPRVVLLDEPTASMDEMAERQFIQRFQAWSPGKTVVIATHRMRVLDLVDRVLVIDGGGIVLDDQKQAALRTMQAGRSNAA